MTLQVLTLELRGEERGEEEEDTIKIISVKFCP